MPRLSPRALATAAAQDPLLPLLLPANARSLPAARAELRWIRAELPRARHRAACLLRRRLVPLQYLLGSQPFHDRLDILCRPGVLIPRWETEEWAARLAALVRAEGPGLLQQNPIFLDLCTGTGCIPLLLAAALAGEPAQPDYVGVDIAPKALRLFARNIRHNAAHLARGAHVSVLPGDVLDTATPLLRSSTAAGAPAKVALLTANPPYIPAPQYASRGADSPTAAGVRRYEPRRALVGDKEFYGAIFAHARTLRADAVVCEVGDASQIAYMQRLAAADVDDDKGGSGESRWDSVAVQDSAGRARAVALWRRAGPWAFLRRMTDPSVF